MGAEAQLSKLVLAPEIDRMKMGRPGAPSSCIASSDYGVGSENAPP